MQTGELRCKSPELVRKEVWAHVLAYNLLRRAEEMGAPHAVGEGFVDGNPLDERGEIIEHVDGSITQPLVILEMATDKDQLRTKLTSPSSWHAAADAERPGFV